MGETCFTGNCILLECLKFTLQVSPGARVSRHMSTQMVNDFHGCQFLGGNQNCDTLTLRFLKLSRFSYLPNARHALFQLSTCCVLFFGELDNATVRQRSNIGNKGIRKNTQRTVLRMFKFNRRPISSRTPDTNNSIFSEQVCLILS